MKPEDLPLTSEELMKMFLKVLYDIQYRKNDSHLTNNLDQIFQEGLERFNNVTLTDEERNRLAKMIDRFKKSELVITPDQQELRRSDKFWVLTKRGKKFVETNFESWLEPGEYILRGLGGGGREAFLNSSLNIGVTCGRCSKYLQCHESLTESDDSLRPRPIGKSIRIVFVVPEHKNHEGAVCPSSGRRIADMIKLYKIIHRESKTTHISLRGFEEHPLREEPN